MTTPNQSPANEYYPPTQQNGDWGQDVTEESVKQWARDQVAPGFGQAYSGNFDLFQLLANAITGKLIPDGMNPINWLSSVMNTNWQTMEDVVDGQLALNNRLDLVEDVSGYCVLQFGTGNGQEMPGSASSSSPPKFFTWSSTPVGPTKNASWTSYSHPTYGEIQGISFDSYGIWQVDAMATANGYSIIGGSANLNMGIYVWDTQTGEVFTNKWNYNEVVNRSRTHQLSMKVVIPEGGRYMAAVGIRHSKAGTVLFNWGGWLQYFGVDRMDIRTDGATNPPPGDGGL